MSSENIFYVVNWSESDVFTDFIKITNRIQARELFSETYLSGWCYLPLFSLAQLPFMAT